MRKKMPIEEFKTGKPARQGFYKARKANGELVIAEWREHEPAVGKAWWTYVTHDPTVEKVRVPLADVVGYAKVDEAEVKRFLQRASTREEQIEDAYASYQRRNSIHPFVRRPVPPNRRVQVGQEVLVGKLRDAVVAGVYQDGEVVVVEHSDVKPRPDGTEHRSFGTWHWIDVLPKEPAKASALAYTPPFSAQAYLSSPLRTLIGRMYKDGVKDNPDYQRGYAWTEADKIRFLDTVFAGRPTGTFVFVKRQGGAPDELLDGKQRMTTLLELVMSVLPYRGVYWHEMTEEDRNIVFQRPVQFAELDDQQYSEADFYEIFLAVNAAGVPQTEEHLNSVREKLAALRAAEAAQKQ
jgi:hypothetical protein